MDVAITDLQGHRISYESSESPRHEKNLRSIRPQKKVISPHYLCVRDVPAADSHNLSPQIQGMPDQFDEPPNAVNREPLLCSQLLTR